MAEDLRSLVLSAPSKVQAARIVLDVVGRAMVSAWTYRDRAWVVEQEAFCQRLKEWRSALSGAPTLPANRTALLDAIREADLDAQRMANVLWNIPHRVQGDGSVLLTGKDSDQLRDARLAWESSSRRMRGLLTALSTHVSGAPTEGGDLPEHESQSIRPDTRASVTPGHPLGDQGVPRAETGEDVWRIAVFREADGRFAAEYVTGDDREGGMGEYSSTPIGALAELISTLIKVAEDKMVHPEPSTDHAALVQALAAIQSQCAGHADEFSARVYRIASDALSRSGEGA